MEEVGGGVGEVVYRIIYHSGFFSIVIGIESLKTVQPLRFFLFIFWFVFYSTQNVFTLLVV